LKKEEERNEIQQKISAVVLVLACLVALAAPVAYVSVGNRTLNVDYSDIKVNVNGATIIPKDVSGKVVMASKPTSTLPILTAQKIIQLRLTV